MQEMDAVESMESVDEDTLVEWTASSRMELAAAAERMLCCNPDRIVWKEQPVDMTSFFISHYLNCIRHPHHDHELILTPVEAAHSLRSLFEELWVAEPKRMENLAMIKYGLEELIRLGNGEIEHAIIFGALEHLFEDPEIQGFFVAWRNDQVLRVAYQIALKEPDMEL